MTNSKWFLQLVFAFVGRQGLARRGKGEGEGEGRATTWGCLERVCLPLSPGADVFCDSMVKVWKIIVHIAPSTVTARASVYENEKLVTRFSDKKIPESMNQRTSHIYHEWEWVGRGKVVAFILSQNNPYQYVHEDFRSVRRPCANKCKETCKSYVPFTFTLTRLLLPYEKVWASRRQALIRPQIGIKMCVGSSFKPLKLLPKNGMWNRKMPVCTQFREVLSNRGSSLHWHPSSTVPALQLLSCI